MSLRTPRRLKKRLVKEFRTAMQWSAVERDRHHASMNAHHGDFSEWRPPAPLRYGIVRSVFRKWMTHPYRRPGDGVLVECDAKRGLWRAFYPVGRPANLAASWDAQREWALWRMRTPPQTYPERCPHEEVEDVGRAWGGKCAACGYQCVDMRWWRERRRKRAKAERRRARRPRVLKQNAARRKAWEAHIQAHVFDGTMPWAVLYGAKP